MGRIRNTVDDIRRDIVRVDEVPPEPVVEVKYVLFVNAVVGGLPLMTIASSVGEAVDGDYLLVRGVDGCDILVRKSAIDSLKSDFISDVSDEVVHYKEVKMTFASERSVWVVSNHGISLHEDVGFGDIRALNEGRWRDIDAEDILFIIASPDVSEGL